jgi:hypothetical protein
MDDRVGAMTCVRPADACRALLGALDASEGRRRRRKRDTTPDTLGMVIKRHLLEQTVLSDPEPDCFEAWLLERCSRAARRRRERCAPWPARCSPSGG